MSILRDAWRVVAGRALHITPLSIRGPADSTDMENLISDVCDFIPGRCFCPTLESYREYACEHFKPAAGEAIADAIDRINDAVSDLRGTLLDLKEEMEEIEAEYACDPRAWENARELGVD